jgi:hypothetical protein
MLVETLKVGFRVVKTVLVLVVELVELAVMELNQLVVLAGTGLVHLLQEQQRYMRAAAAVLLIMAVALLALVVAANLVYQVLLIQEAVAVVGHKVKAELLLEVLV